LRVSDAGVDFLMVNGCENDGFGDGRHASSIVNSGQNRCFQFFIDFTFFIDVGIYLGVIGHGFEVILVAVGIIWRPCGGI